jgi:antitoxin component of RelBE/YafQ-DinJ toxin-antitoxin module
MKKIEPKGTINKQISIKLTEAELNRFKAFCKALDMNYSEVFRAMSNQVIKKETKKLGLELKAFEPEITFNACLEPKVSQLEIFNQFFTQDFSLTANLEKELNARASSQNEQ